MSGVAQATARGIAERRTVLALPAGAKTVVCMWCEHVIAQGHVDAPLSHTVCGSARCDHLASNPWGIVTVEGLYEAARDQFARWTVAAGDRVQPEYLEYRRADARFRRALKKLIEDKEAGR